MGRLKDYKQLAVVLGILVVAGPVLWFSARLQQQGEAEVSAASWTIGNAEVQIGRAVAVLDDLAHSGVDGCGASQVDLLQRRMLTAGPVKELSVIGPNGQTLCSDYGSTIAPRTVVSSVATTDPNIVLDVVQLGNDRALRVRRREEPPGAVLAAILPTELLLPQVAADGSRFTGYARIALSDGTVVGEVGTDVVSAPQEGLVGGRARSERYGIAAVSAMGRHGAFATYSDLGRAGIAITGLLALIILVAALTVPRRERVDPFSEIERAIDAGEFVPYYQPVVDIKSGSIVGAEVLVRWRKRDGSLVPPANFIPVLESTDLILEMTRSLMRQVGDELGPLLEQRANMYVAFNIAPRHLASDQLIDDIGSIFVGGPISTSQIVLEVTERYEIENLGETRDLIASLQGLGCRVAIDDVGTGHNGLSYILKLGVDVIKIDKMFVDAIRTESHSRAIVETLVDLARNLRMQIVAEGVEDFEQVIYLRDHGISLAQGFVFSPPLPGAAFVQLVEALDPTVPKVPRAVFMGEATPAAASPRHAAA